MGAAYLEFALLDTSGVDVGGEWRYGRLMGATSPAVPDVLNFTEVGAIITVDGVQE